MPIKDPKPRKGRATLFPGKQYPGICLTPTKIGRRILKDAMKRTALSATDVMEVLLRLHGPSLGQGDLTKATNLAA